MSAAHYETIRALAASKKQLIEHTPVSSGGLAKAASFFLRC